jgi:CBS domain-containing protein
MTDGRFYHSSIPASENKEEQRGVVLYVKDVMTRKVETIGPEETMRAAAQSMESSHVGSLIVATKGGRKPLGIVTEGDISRAVARKLDPEKALVKAIMSKRLVTIGPRKTVEEAARTMTNAGIKKLPVVERGEITGMVTQTDIVAASSGFISILKEMVEAGGNPSNSQHRTITGNDAK